MGETTSGMEKTLLPPSLLLGKLGKSLYSLKESPLSWYNCVNNFAETLGFHKSKNGYCLYVKVENMLSSLDLLKS